MKIIMGSMAMLIAVGSMGCVTVQRQLDEINRIDRECRTQKSQGKLATWVEATQCANDRMREVYACSGQWYMDLIEVRLASRLLVAERLDAGQLTEAEAAVVLAQVETLIAQESQRRNLAANNAANQQLIGIGAAMQGLGILNQSLNPPPPPLVIVPSGR